MKSYRLRDALLAALAVHLAFIAYILVDAGGAHLMAAISMLPTLVLLTVLFAWKGMVIILIPPALAIGLSGALLWLARPGLLRILLVACAFGIWPLVVYAGLAQADF